MDRQRREGFSWGAHDCALGLACGAIEAITGHDLGAEWRGAYDTPKAAIRAMKAAGYLNLAEAVLAYLPETNPAFARVGDIGLIEEAGPLGYVLCVVDSGGLIVLTETGHGRRPREDMTRAFRVG